MEKAAVKRTWKNGTFVLNVTANHQKNAGTGGTLGNKKKLSAILERVKMKRLKETPR